MPKHATKVTSNRNEADPGLFYDEKLELSKKLAAYRFWLHIATDGKEGWNPTEKSGSVWNYRSSNYIKQHIKESSWPNIGKVSDLSE